MASQKFTFIQIGMTALRNPDQSFQPAVPLYIRVTAEDVDENSGTDGCSADAPVSTRSALM